MCIQAHWRVPVSETCPVYLKLLVLWAAVEANVIVGICMFIPVEPIANWYHVLTIHWAFSFRGTFKPK